MLSSTEYFKDLVRKFADLGAEIENEESIHSKMECFSDYTIEQIKKVDLSEIQKCFDFQEEKISDLNPELLNAMTVSYCESLLLGDIGKIMHDFTKYMKPKLFKMYSDYETYYYKLIDGTNRGT